MQIRNKILKGQKLLKIYFRLISLDIFNLYKLFNLYKWYKLNKFSPPSPPFVKRQVLLRHGIKNSTWIETGTFKGETTKFLAKNFPLIHTIEPSKELLIRAKSKLSNFKNIIFHNGTSEECFEAACNSVKGDVSFWLDGHFSSGNTFKAVISTPIKHELNVIQNKLKDFSNLVVIIDDLRCSYRENSDYPELDFYVNWAKSNNLLWYIEHDIFIMKSKDKTFFT